VQTPETLPPNTSGKVEIRTISGSVTYPYNSYLITSSAGATAVVDPTSMPSKEKLLIDPVIIVSTHTHFDHVDPDFIHSCDCEKIIAVMGDITVGDFHAFTILSSHSDDNIGETSGNLIVVFEVDGLRIAHMGDIGQTFLTEEQLEQLGEIDIVFMQFDNSYSGMSVKNEKGFALIEQLNPKIIIPTHYKTSEKETLIEKYGPITELDDILAISVSDLPEDTLNVYIIENNYNYS
jgi:L-ascorbate metabolism protein UlaG (beta-lactamase superfamily)